MSDEFAQFIPQGHHGLTDGIEQHPAAEGQLPFGIGAVDGPVGPDQGGAAADDAGDGEESVPEAVAVAGGFDTVVPAAGDPVEQR